MLINVLLLFVYDTEVIRHTLCGVSFCTASIWNASESQWYIAGSVPAVYAFEGKLRLLLSIVMLAFVSVAIF
jgi:hypothetical protein